MVVGAIPLEDSNVDRDTVSIEEHPQSEQQATNEVLQCPRLNEEQNLRVYARRQRHQAEQEHVQGGKPVLWR